jgi:dTDP-glucose pyrophosphorylase
MIGIIPAAGFGTRLLELGKAYPKSILPYRERPLLVWNVEWLRRQGCTDIRVVVSYQAEKIREVANQYDLDITIIEPMDMSGLSMSVRSALEVGKVGGPVLIVLGDIIVETDVVETVGNWVSTFEVSDWSRWCLLDAKTGDFYDKPKEKPPTNRALSGVYFIEDSKDLLDKLREQCESKESIGGELQISTSLAKLGVSVQSKDLEVLDFGTLSSYLRNRGLRNSRSFNTVCLKELTVVKSSKQRGKIAAEYNWFRNVPEDIQLFCPRIVKSDLIAPEAQYEMERVYLPTLRELYLFFDRSEETWKRIFDSCEVLWKRMGGYNVEESSFENVYQKTISRREGVGSDQIVSNFLEDFRVEGQKVDRDSQLQHGDFCFSNLFWDEAKESVVMVDPRGDLIGSRYYDWAKLRHSAIYNYDFIDAELYTICDGEVTLFDSGTSQIGELLREKELVLFSEQERSYLELLTASLFLSMIPLHSHSAVNQNLFYKKFVEIYECWRVSKMK